jgi:PAS domain S-box-containing protein
MYWGPRFTVLYNDAYISFLGATKHPRYLGQPGRECWAEIWDTIEPMLQSVYATGKATWSEDLRMFFARGLPLEEVFVRFTFGPLLARDGRTVDGIFCPCTETTEQVVGARRLETLRKLGVKAAEAQTVDAACKVTEEVLADNPHDIPFAAIYVADAAGTQAVLSASARLPEGADLLPRSVSLTDGGPFPWPFASVARSQRAEEVPDLGALGRPLPGGPYPEPTTKAVVLPIAAAAHDHLAGLLVVGVSPRRLLDAAYRTFFDLVAGHIGTAIADAKAYEAERERAESLAELDRAKTAFFSNVSHEFRTPLTLMLGPIEELLAKSQTDLPPAAAGQLEVVNRNGLRLLRLVNTLLDFSRLEAGRVEASYQPTDLAAFTAELASVFRAACERAGLRLVVDCLPLEEPVYVDREMWEKVVLNLLSNAFKFTLDGEIAVTLRQAGRTAELRVKDTGTGIPAEEMPRVFERFHRVQNAQGRTHEGSGIGLALVQELVKLQGGSVTAESVVGTGTTFTVTIPLGSAHLPSDRIGGSRSLASTTTGAQPFIEEALRWLPEPVEAEGDPGSELPTHHEILPLPVVSSGPARDDDRPRVLVADDNADMRQYVARLLAERYRVEAVPDGEAALLAARERPPDLVLTDVMMPRLDGFGLLRELRADPRTADLPVIMLSARAGEESRVEGIEAGADDYLVKPFTARELVARVTAHLQMLRLRREANEALRASEGRLRLMADAMPQIVYVAEAGGAITFINQQWRHYTGQPDALTANLGSVVHPDDLRPMLRGWEQAHADGAPFQCESRLRRAADGEYRWFLTRAVPHRNGEGGIIQWYGTSTDIHEQKQAEQRVRESEKRLQFALDSARMGSWEWNAVTGEVIWSVKTRELFGVDAETPITIDVFESCLHPEDVEPNRKRTEDALATGEYENEYRVVLPGGAVRWIAARGLFLRDDRGRPTRMLGVVADTTERKRLEEELHHQSEALREADRRKDQFLATLAHELRNPLAPVRNAVQVLHMKGPATPELRWARDVIDRQVQGMTRLIDDLMDVSRISLGKLELKRERVELASVVHGAVETSRPLIEQQRHELTVTVPPDPVVLDGDVTRLAQVFANLLNNAAKYTEPGGRIDLTVDRQGGEVAVSVKDNGIGIPTDKLGSVFEMFAQVQGSLERSQGGLGIGLSLVNRLVEMHDGSIEARSDGSGKGSEFVVRLPVVGGRSHAATTGGEGDRPFPAPNLRILIVDDNRDGADSLGVMLRTMGNEISTAYDGQQALDKATEFRPDVVLLDIGLPKLNGYEVCRRIREQPGGTHMVLVAVTGWGQGDDKRRAQEAGFDRHMVKPVDPQALMKMLAGMSDAARM